MTTAPADSQATSTPAPRPRPGHHFTTVQKLLIGVVATLVLVIAGIGFAGSYDAVSHLAAAKGFGRFATVFPIGLDSGIGAFLALDLLLTWLRIPFPLLRYGAWTLTVATVAFNAAAAWPDPLGVGMHAVIPVLFVIAVEAARHAVGRIADITADKHIELPPIKRWFVAPWPTFRLWRRQILWDVRSYEQAIICERQLGVYRARLKAKYGKKWRRNATPDDLLALRLATRGGMTIAAALALPEEEAAELANAERERQRTRDADQAERDRQEREDREAAARAALARRLEEEEADRQRAIAEAQTRAQLAAIERQEQEAQAEIDRRHAEEQAVLAARKAAAEQAAADAAAARLRAEQETRREAERTAQIRERMQAASRAASASASTGRPAGTGSRPAPASANRSTASSAAPASASAAASRAANDQPADHTEVVAAYQQLQQELGKAPSDAALGERLGVGRSRAQQLRTAAIEAGHTELAKALRIA